MAHGGSTIQCLVGREAEMRRIDTALRNRKSQLLWGPKDSGKTALFMKVIANLAEPERRKVICWTGTATRRELVEHLIRELYFARDTFVRKKVHADHFSEINLRRWINRQSALRLRGILLTAAEQGSYSLFLDHLSPLPDSIAKLMKEIINRTKTPVYFTGSGHSQHDIGHAWSLYWTDEYRTHVGPLADAAAHELLEASIHTYGLNSLDLVGFRDEILRLSAHVPGSIVKMCEMAAHPRYQYRNKVKLKLVHVDYLMNSRLPFGRAYESRQ